MPRSQAIVQVALPVPLLRVFDYRLPESCGPALPGSRVQVPFGARKLVGVVIKVSDHSEYPAARLKSVIAVLDSTPLLAADLLELLQWAANYYHFPLGEVISAALPSLLRSSKPAQMAQVEYWRLTDAGREADVATLQRAPVQRHVFEFMRESGQPVAREQLADVSKTWRTAMNALAKKGLVESTAVDDLALVTNTPVAGPLLNEEQLQAVSRINAVDGQFRAFLLNGITGSGKTEVYLGAIDRQLAQGRQVLMLVPEIGLTPQLVSRVRARVNVPVLVMHSALTDIQRSNAWLQAASGGPAVVLGTRSAVFTPLPQLGLVVIDEEHDQSFKQQDGFRYHARDLAVMRASRQQVPIVLGSATPSLESMLNVRNDNYTMLTLTERAGDALLPRVGLLDMRQQALNDGLSPPLITAIRQRLEKGEQSLLFLNRRGYAPVIMCHACGWTQSCPRCDAHMIMHRFKQLSRCHHCGHETPLPTACPSCANENLKPVGEGTERVEESLRRLFPSARIDRVDRDSTVRKGSLEQKLEDIQQGKVDIIVGTQMLSKGHDFPMITLVGVLNADQGLYGADFRGPEFLIQQVMQVSGRAGRADRNGEVLIQTWHPDHAVFKALMAHDYRQFVDAELEQRHQAGFPPHVYFALLRAEATDPGAALHFLQRARQSGSRLMNSEAGLELFDAVSAPMEKRAGRYRAQLLVKSSVRAPLHNLLSAWLPQLEGIPEARKVRWSIDVDPMDMY